MARCSPIKDFIFPKNNRYDKLGLYVYIFGEHEQDAFRNELYQVVMDMPKKRLQEYKNVFGTFNDIAINIINDYKYISMVYLYDEIIELYKKNDYIKFPFAFFSVPDTDSRCKQLYWKPLPPEIRPTHL